MSALSFLHQNLNGQIGPLGINAVFLVEEEVRQDTEDAPLIKIPLLIPVLERPWISEIARNYLVETRLLKPWLESGQLGNLGALVLKLVVQVFKRDKDSAEENPVMDQERKEWPVISNNVSNGVNGEPGPSVVVLVEGDLNPDQEHVQF